VRGDGRGERQHVDLGFTGPVRDRLKCRLEGGANELRVRRQVSAGVEPGLAFAAAFWPLSHPTPTLAARYGQVPRWGHVALDFAPRLRSLLEATATGLAGTMPE
jgi:hypothetical protein